jgi:ribonuclease P protein component
VGLIVPKHKQTAVARNRVKRRLRECARLTLLPALRGREALDVVLRATPAAYLAAGAALAADVRRIADRLVESVRPHEEAGTP